MFHVSVRARSEYAILLSFDISSLQGDCSIPTWCQSCWISIPSFIPLWLISFLSAPAHQKVYCLASLSTRVFPVDNVLAFWGPYVCAIVSTVRLCDLSQVLFVSLTPTSGNPRTSLHRQNLDLSHCKNRRRQSRPLHATSLQITTVRILFWHPILAS
jgi:hypothetical protein